LRSKSGAVAEFREETAEFIEEVECPKSLEGVKWKTIEEGEII
jgi:hypothetical protein